MLPFENYIYIKSEDEIFITYDDVMMKSKPINLE
jgi:hypothetical protein